MKDTLSLYFNKSNIILDHLNISLISDFINLIENRNITKQNLCDNFYNYAIKRKDYGEFDELIREALSVDYEKIKLRDNTQNLRKIKQFDRNTNIIRETLLLMNDIEILDIEFKVSPNIKTYESNWQMVEKFEEDKEYLTSNIIKNKADFYFLLQRIGIYDSILKTNILEYYISEYQYFVLQILESPKKAKTALEEFVQVFEIVQKDDYNDVKVFFISLLKENIYRKFIVQK